VRAHDGRERRGIRHDVVGLDVHREVARLPLRAVDDDVEARDAHGAELVGVGNGDDVPDLNNLNSVLCHDPP
jgi:hypothetical protein